MYSVVVATFNRAPSLSVTLKSLLAQDTSLPYEIIVVDNNSSDETRAVVRALEEKAQGKLRYLFESRQGLSMARNAGIVAAGGEVVAFIDDDAIASPDWLAALAAAYRDHPDAWCIGGKIVLSPHVVLPSWVDPTSEFLRGCLVWHDHGDDTIKLEYPSDVWGANFSVRRDALLQVGLFNPNLGWDGVVHHLSGEETELCLRIHRVGGPIYYSGQAVVTHLFEGARLTKRYFRQRAYWQGRTLAILFPQDPRRTPWRRVARFGIDVVSALYHYGFGDVRGAFECELRAWSRLGNLQQTLLMARDG